MQQSTQQMGEWKERGGWNTSVSAHRFAEDVAILAVVVAELKLDDIRQSTVGSRRAPVRSDLIASQRRCPGKISSCTRRSVEIPQGWEGRRRGLPESHGKISLPRRRGAPASRWPSPLASSARRAAASSGFQRRKNSMIGAAAGSSTPARTASCNARAAAN